MVSFYLQDSWVSWRAPGLFVCFQWHVCKWHCLVQKFFILFVYVWELSLLRQADAGLEMVPGQSAKVVEAHCRGAEVHRRSTNCGDNGIKQIAVTLRISPCAFVFMFHGLLALVAPLKCYQEAIALVTMTLSPRHCVVQKERDSEMTAHFLLIKKLLFQTAKCRYCCLSLWKNKRKYNGLTYEESLKQERFYKTRRDSTCISLWSNN